MLFFKHFSLSLLDIMKISKLKNTIKICANNTTWPNIFVKKNKKKIMKDDLKNTVYLNTAIIEKE